MRLLFDENLSPKLPQRLIDLFPNSLSKLSRGFDRDLKDVQAMYEQKLFSLRDLRDCFEAISLTG